MRLSRFINSLLGLFDIRVSRRSTLDQLHSNIFELSHEIDLLRAELSKPENSYGYFQETIRHQIACKWSIVDYLEAQQPQCASKTCPVCDFTGGVGKFEVKLSHCIFGGGRLIRHTCPECCATFGPDKMFSLTSEELAQDYEWHYKVYQEGDSTEQEIRAFMALEPHKDGVYLNYGAGTWSNSIRRLRADGWNVLGFEPHSGSGEEGDIMITSAAELKDHKFDGIFSNNVLEHLRFPASTLVELSCLLKEHGKMAHATPCYEYLYAYTRFHLYFLSGASRKFIWEKAGLRETNFIQDAEFMCSVLECKP